MLGADYFMLGTSSVMLDAKKPAEKSNQEVFEFFFDHLFVAAT
jgi:hypothetical protein